MASPWFVVLEIGEGVSAAGAPLGMPRERAKGRTMVQVEVEKGETHVTGVMVCGILLKFMLTIMIMVPMT